jgi:fructosamine-3-kinase
VAALLCKEMPAGTHISNMTAHGTSLWTRTARIDAARDASPVQYFLKVLPVLLASLPSSSIDPHNQVVSGQDGKGIVSAEFTAMSAIHKVSPSLVPRPIAWGTYDQIPNLDFFLCEFRNMTGGLPDLEQFPAQVARLHRNSASPDGRFGFHTATYHGNIAISHGWSHSWEEYFARTTRTLLALDQEVQGPSEVIARLSKPFFDKVIPRLLRPLETGGRVIKPCLIHGDLWHGNASMDRDTGEPVMFDAASFYAHNECKLAPSVFDGSR